MNKLRPFVYIKNVTGKQQQYHLQLSYEVEGQGGIVGLYSPGLVTIEGGQTIAVDIRRLRDEQVGDEAGRLIPVEASRGQVLWSVRGKENLTLIGRAEQADFAEAVSSTYGCQNCCPDSFYDGWCDPQIVDGVVGDTTQFTSTQQDQNCYGTIQTGYIVVASWSSSDESVATIDGFGFATAEGPGSTGIFADWFVTSYLLLSGFPECIEEEEPFFASAVCTVVSADIGPLLAVPKNQTVSVQVTLSPAPSQENVELTLSALSGTGEARFASNNSTTLTINQTTSVEIKGITESSTRDNIRLTAKMGTQELDTEDFSILFVTLSLRTGPNASVSTDNSAAAAYSQAVGTTNLGTFFSTGTNTHLWSTGVEIVGTVKPSDFQGLIVLEREAVAIKTYLDMTLEDSGGPMGDTSPSQIRDDDPQSGMSGGKVYDLDAPGIGSASADPVNAVLRLRVNFRQWATFNFIRASNDLPWFSRISIRKTSSGDVLHIQSGITGDNVAGLGTTNLTWNLQ